MALDIKSLIGEEPLTTKNKYLKSSGLKVGLRACLLLLTVKAAH